MTSELVKEVMTSVVAPTVDDCTSAPLIFAASSTPG